jgi:hypothetical protein
LEIFIKAKQQKITTQQAAKQLAEERIVKAKNAKKVMAMSY